MSEAIKRSRKLVEYVRRHPGVSMAHVVRHFDISERTLRNRVVEANDLLNGSARLYARRGKGYCLQVNNARAFLEWLNDERPGWSKRVPETPEGRAVFLTNYLLNRSEWITLDALSDVLCVSRKSISRDLVEVERKLVSFGLKLSRRSHYGIKVEGGEMGRRLCLARLAIEAIEDENLTKDDEKGYVELFNQVEECVSVCVSRQNIEIDSFLLQNLFIHIAIAVLRIRSECYIPMDGTSMQCIRNSASYEDARFLAAAIEDRFSISLPEEEVAYIAIHLDGKRNASDDGAIEKGRAWELAGKMIATVRDIYDVDLTSDLDLRLNLSKHLEPLMVRLQYGMGAQNPMLAEVKTRYPLAYSMALDAVSAIDDFSPFDVSDEEVGYIAMSFELSLERRKTNLNRKVNIVLVCASSAGSARLLAEQMKRRFASSIGVVHVCDVSRLSQLDLSEIDCIFTTVELGVNLPVPAYRIGLFLDEDDAPVIGQALSSSLNEMGLSAVDAIDERLFFPHLKFERKDDVLKFLCKRIQEHEDVPADFLELLLEREKAAETCFGNHVAIPHPSRPVSKRTFVAVVVLDEPLTWNGRDVSAVFLVSISRDAQFDLDRFYREMSVLLASKDGIAQIIKHQDFQTLKELLGGKNHLLRKKVEKSEDDWSGLLE